jgi:WD40 repeat protein
VLLKEPEGFVTIWNAETGQKVDKYQSSTKPVRTVAWSPDGLMIASGGNDHKVYLWTWDPQTSTIEKTPRYIYPRHTDTVLTLAWSPDSTHLASAGEDKAVHIWRVPQQ